MIFSRTKESLQNLQKQERLSVGEMLAVMQDLMQDIQDETGSSPAQLPADDTALQKWRTLAHVLVRIPLDDAVQQTSEKQKQRIQTLQNELAARHAKTAETASELEQGAAEIEKLNSELESLNHLKSQTEAQNAAIRPLRDRVAALRNELEQLPDPDEKLLSETAAALEQQKAKRLEQSAVLQRMQEQLAAEKRSVESAVAEHSAAENTQNALRAQIAALKNETAQMQEEKTKLNADAERLRNECELLKEIQIPEARSKAEKANADCIALRESLTALEEKAAAAQTAQKDAQAEHDAAKADCEGLLAKLDALCTETNALRSDTESMRETLKQTVAEKDSLSALVTELKLDNDTCLAEIAKLKYSMNYQEEQKKVLLEKKVIQEQALQSAQAEYDTLLAAQSEQEQTLTDLQDAIAQKKKDAEQVDAEIRTLGEQQQNLIHEIKEKQYMRDNSDAAQLQAQLESLNAELAELKRTNEEMSTQSNSLTQEIEGERISVRTAAQQLEVLKKQAEDAKMQRQTLEAESREQKQILETCRSDIAEYQKAFSPEQYAAQKHEIERCRAMLQIYQDAVTAICEQNIPAEYFVQNGLPILQEKQAELQSQLDGISAAMENLRKDYLTLIEETESKVNLYAM